jgi:predicted dehydrogenase
VQCAAYENLEDLLARERLDVLDICTPGFLHARQAAQALDAGCNVLVEKPPSHSADQADILREMARCKGLKLGAVLNYRYRDLVLGLKKLVENGTLGQVVKVHIVHHGPLVYTDAPWLWDEAQSKYLLWEYGIHLLDILVHLLGPHKHIVHVLPFVQPALGHTTDLEITAEFGNGAVGRLEITADSTRHSSQFTRINVYGTAMDAFVRWFPPSLRVVAGIDSPIELLRDEIKAICSVGLKLVRGQFIQHRNISHYRLISSYMDWIQGRTEFLLAFDKIMPTLRLLSQIESLVPTYRPDAVGMSTRHK